MQLVSVYGKLLCKKLLRIPLGSSSVLPTNVLVRLVGLLDSGCIGETSGTVLTVSLWDNGVDHRRYKREFHMSKTIGS